MGVGACNEVELAFTPLSVGNKQIFIHLVDADTHELVCGWLLHSSTSVPPVSRTYDVRLQLGVAVAFETPNTSRKLCCG